MEQLYTPREVAEMLRVHVKTLARWRRDGDGPVFTKVGGAVRYTQTALDDYIDAVRAVR